VASSKSPLAPSATKTIGDVVVAAGGSGRETRLEVATLSASPFYLFTPVVEVVSGVWVAPDFGTTVSFMFGGGAFLACIHRRRFQP
jgi:hypothetical protein